MVTRLLIFFLIISFSYSCKRTGDSSDIDSVIKIDLISEPGSTLKKISEFASNIEYMPLQTTTNSLIGSFVRKVVTTDKSIYILCGSEIFCFNMNGEFLFKIQSKGRGPEEYTSINDFDISSDNKILSILSPKKLLIYGISETGFTFTKSVTLKDPTPYLVNIVPETDKVFLSVPPWTGTEPTLSLMTNIFGDTIYFKPNCYKYENVRNSNFMALNEMLAYSFENKVCFKEKFGDTVFYVNAIDNSFKPRIIFDSHGTVVTPKMRGGSEKVGNNTTFVPYVLETSRYIFYWYFKGESLNGILFDKSTMTKFKLDAQNDLNISLPDDLGGGPDFKIEYINRNYCTGGKLFSFVDAITLKNYVTGEDFINAQANNPKKKDELKNLANSLKETDNPVLIVVTPKE